MSRSSKSVIKDLNRGVIPNELTFRLYKNDCLDWEKLQYNNKYKSKEFFENQFPDGMLSLPGFDKVIEMMVMKAKTPLQEMEERQKQAEIIDFTGEIILTNDIQNEQIFTESSV